LFSTGKLLQFSVSIIKSRSKSAF